MSKALLLIDFQHDFLDPHGRLPVATEQVPAVVEAANKAIAAALAAGDHVVAIGNEFRHSDVLGNLFRHYAAVEGSQGARWDDRISIADTPYFPKWRANAFCNRALGTYLIEQNVDEVILAGLYASACVTATARGALARGLKVSVLSEAVADASARARAAALKRLSRSGVTVTTAGDTHKGP